MCAIARVKIERGKSTCTKNGRESYQNKKYSVMASRVARRIRLRPFRSGHPKEIG
jgi:hypothetical protein